MADVSSGSGPTSKVMSEESGTGGIGGAVGSAYRLLRRFVTGVLVLAFLLGWTGFWTAVVRIHYLNQDWVGVAVTAAVGLFPVATLIVWETSIGAVGARIGDIVDRFLPSSTASTSGS